MIKGGRFGSDITLRTRRSYSFVRSLTISDARPSFNIYSENTISTSWSTLMSRQTTMYAWKSCMEMETQNSKVRSLYGISWKVRVNVFTTLDRFLGRKNILEFFKGWPTDGVPGMLPFRTVELLKAFVNHLANTGTQPVTSFLLAPCPWLILPPKKRDTRRKEAYWLWRNDKLHQEYISTLLNHLTYDANLKLLSLHAPLDRCSQPVIWSHVSRSYMHGESEEGHDDIIS